MHTLSRQQRDENSRMFWNVRVMPLCAIRYGRSPEIVSPRNRTTPEVGL